MMNTEFQIDVRDWLGDANSGDVEDATFAALSVVAIDQQEPRGDPRQIVTRVHDTVDNSVREYIRVSAYDLAACMPPTGGGFAGNLKEVGVTGKCAIRWRLQGRVICGRMSRMPVMARPS